MANQWKALKKKLEKDPELDALYKDALAQQVRDEQFFQIIAKKGFERPPYPNGCIHKGNYALEFRNYTFTGMGRRLRNC